MGCALGVGSQRIAIQDPGQAHHFRIRDVAPDVTIFANLGAVQLNAGLGLDACLAAVEMVEADALILHLNPLQEALQKDGDHDFRGLEERIARICEDLPIPVIVKEIGFGISASVALRLAAAGVAAIDVSGAGGTSWSSVEAHRAQTPMARAVAEVFGEWGIGTATSLCQVRYALPDLPLIASGGLVNGLDAAKALALGAQLAGFAGTLLRSAVDGTASVIEQLEILSASLRLTMFCVGAGAVDDLGPHLLMPDQAALGSLSWNGGHD
jgi:isopentenyl-diphosphate delta-isomerase